VMSVQAEETPDLWLRLEELVSRAERWGVRSMSGEELMELGGLYRRAAARLSFARSRPLDIAQRERLNALVGRAYARLYRAGGKPALSLRVFVLREFPAAFRLNFRFFAVALLVTLAGALTGLTAANREDAADALLGPGASGELRQIAQRHSEVGPRNWLPDEARPAASTWIIANNLKVSAAALALGITGGIGTVLVLWYNGLLLGLVGAVVHQHNVDVDFWAFVLPHGVIELTAVFIAGAAGLMIGYALLFPGKLYRGEAVKLAGRQAVKLLMGCALLLLGAGVIEAFLSPVPEIPHEVKFAFALVGFLCLYAYLLGAGHGAPAPSGAPISWLAPPIEAWLAAERPPSPRSPGRQLPEGDVAVHGGH